MEIIERFSEIFFQELTDYYCPYYNDGRISSIELVYPLNMEKSLYHKYLELGYCRSGEFYFQNRCKGCEACIPLRLKIDSFQPDRSQKRILKKNADIQISILKSQELSDEKIELFSKYKSARHPDNDIHNYESEARQIHYGYPQTLQIEYFLNHRLIGVSIVDEAEDSFSSHCFYYDPEYLNRSLGVYSAIMEMALAKKMKKTYFYMGFYLKEIRNMAYKRHFKPNELYIDGVWKEGFK